LLASLGNLLYSSANVLLYVSQFMSFTVGVDTLCDMSVSLFHYWLKLIVSLKLASLQPDINV